MFHIQEKEVTFYFQTKKVEYNSKFHYNATSENIRMENT